MATHTPSTHVRGGRVRSTLLWTAQILLAALFVMAGTAKLLMPAEALAQQASLPVAFLRFIAVAELLGASGLVLPGVFRVKRYLTPLAAAGLIVIMVGATVISAVQLGAAAAILPAVTGVLLVTVARGRRAWVFPGARAETVPVRHARELAA